MENIQRQKPSGAYGITIGRKLVKTNQRKERQVIYQPAYMYVERRRLGCKYDSDKLCLKKTTFFQIVKFIL
jgi:hypothetical protein